MNQRISRRKALSDLTKIAGAAALSFSIGGLAGYLLGSKFRETVTKTVVSTSTLTIYKTETQTVTSTKTITRTYTTTKTERPEIRIEVEVGKSYNATVRDYEVGLKVVGPELDSLKAYYENASISGVLDRWERRVTAYYSSFLTHGEIGEQRIRLEVEKDGVRAEKEFSIDIGLGEDEIAQSPLDRDGLKILWRDLLEDVGLNLDREEVFRKEYEIVREMDLKHVERASSLYLKQLSTYLTSNQGDHKPILRGLQTILQAIDVYPQIVYGNWVEDFDRAEFLINDYRAYLLSRLLSEVECDLEHVYAARAMVDQIDTFAKCLMIDPWDVLEYEANRLQLWDLAKQLFQKHLRFEASGKRASVKAKDLLKRWSNREKINNRHIYLGMREVQLPPYALIYDVEKMMYGKDYDEEMPRSPGFGGPYPPFKVKEKCLNILRKFVEKYEYYNEKLNLIVKNPEMDVRPGDKYDQSPKKFIRWYLNPNETWNKKYFPNSTKEAYEDCFNILFFKGSLESRVPIILYTPAVYWNEGYEEGRVEGNILFSSYLDYPVFRVGVDYPKNTDRGGMNHGEFSFILNEKDEELLYQRSKDELFLDEKYTYSLFFLWTRKPALEKDQAELGEIENITIQLPLELHYPNTPWYDTLTVYWIKKEKIG